MHSTDVVVVGAGIVGLATAAALLDDQPGLDLVVLDKEDRVAAHQSSHNSGVVHSGLYYRPGTQKARLCAAGRDELERYCEAREIELDRCGKVVVAADDDERARLDELAERGRRNGLEVVPLGPEGLADHEPHATGVAAVFVPATGVVDFAAVCRSLAREVEAAGGRFALGRAVTGIEERLDRAVVETSDGPLRTERVVSCAGLQADLVARAAGVSPPVRIVAFRGEYASVVPERAFLVRHLIYPVPDPRVPFLGVHLTRGIDGHVHAGPNAVLALAREGYRWRDVSASHLRELAMDTAMWKLARRHWRTGLHEIARSRSPHRLVADLQRLVPDLRRDDLVVGTGAGVRAQAVDHDGALLDDFSVQVTRRCVHVLNAPSPAATASLAIARWIVARLRSTSTDDVG